MKRLGIICVTVLWELGLVLGYYTVQGQDAKWPVYQLNAEQEIPLDLPRREAFQASGLLLTKDGLLTVSDTSPTLYRIELPDKAGSGKLRGLTNYFTWAKLSKFKGYRSTYDCEGIAHDEQGRLYMCEEANRWVFRCDPKSGTTELLDIDWTPVKQFFSSDRNASFEGIAIGDGKLYLANERSEPVIIQVDLKTLKVEGHFVATPKGQSLLGILHYSDLSWHKGKLYVLCRHHRVVLEVDPKKHTVVAEYNYRDIEDKLGYQTHFPTGMMEGLAVNDQFIWLATDNNGLPRNGNDTRPTLLKCLRGGRSEMK